MLRMNKNGTGDPEEKKFDTSEILPQVSENKDEQNLAPVHKEPTSKWETVIPLEYFAVRAAPNSTATVLLYLARGKPVLVELSGKVWLKVKHPKLVDRVGYVSSTILNDQPVKK